MCSVTRWGNEAPTSCVPSRSTSSSVSSTTRGAIACTSRASPASPASSASRGYWSRTIATHEADGDTTSSSPAKTRTKRFTSGTASSW